MRLRNCQTLAVPPPKLNLGCGYVTPEGFHNIDVAPGPNVHTVMDVEHGPLPFEDGSVNAVLTSHVLEHMAHLEFVMAEIHRVLKVGGLLEVYVPYGHNKAFNHIRFFWPRGPREIGNVRSKPMSALLPWKLRLNEVSQRGFPFQWHLIRYLHWNPNFGFKQELHFVLEKITKGEFESRFVF
ncbi:MAG TPA: methyltransferase domain-containing protein [Thermoplasmata archaeon]|nr:methyltransferase domain-containing protein [Thermoplasmata archaeon]